LRTDRRPYPAGRRTLIIHSGGDSKRLPHCSAQGKLFARIPRTLPDGRASTIFDEFLISLSGLAPILPPGALVASGDVLLVFDHLQLSFRRQGATGVAAAAPAEMGLRHGVFVSEPESTRVAAYLHKPGAEELARWDAARDGQVRIDTGLVWFDGDLIRRLGSVAANPAVADASLNLYGDLLLPLAGSTEHAAYLADESDGPATPAVKAARKVIWSLLRGTPFAVEQVQPAVFVHFGSSREYWQMAAADPELAALCGWEGQAASWGGEAVGAGQLVAINTSAEGDIAPGPAPLLAADCCLEGSLAWDGPALLSGVHTGLPLALGPDIALDQLPLSNGDTVTRCFGLCDDPKRRMGDPRATFCNRPWDAWLAAARVAPADLWDDATEGERSLWNARLFPALPSPDASLMLALPLQQPERAADGWRDAWLAAPRLSLAQSAALADGDRLLAGLIAVEDHVAARRFLAGAAAEEPAASIKRVLGQTPAARGRRAALVNEWLLAGDPMLQLRGLRALSEATGDPAWEDAAFAALARMIEAATPWGALRSARPARDPRGALPARRASAAARIDFGGGWTDTPPHSMERGGAVLNAAVTLGGQHPIIAEARTLDAPRLVLQSRDLDMTVEPSCAGEILRYANPADPFALHKAALVLRGIVPPDAPPDLPLSELLRDTGGIGLTTATRIPFGSGLGTSSILAGAVLAALGDLAGEEVAGQARGEAVDEQRLFDEVLCLEQMLTTGGGWQDQVGGLTGGIKLVTSQPGLPQRITIEPLRLDPATERELAARLCLVYTGQQRLAKNLLRNVMSRWMAREPETVWIQAEIARLARAMRAALQAGDVDGFGALLGEHWLLNKRMDPGCANPFIDDLFDTMRPHINGGKLAGAGGGGFASVVARSDGHVAALSAALAERYPGTRVAVWPCAVPQVGLRVETVPEEH
jgi:fucokinase